MLSIGLHVNVKVILINYYASWLQPKTLWRDSYNVGNKRKKSERNNFSLIVNNIHSSLTVNYNNDFEIYMF